MALECGSVYVSFAESWERGQGETGGREWVNHFSKWYSWPSRILAPVLDTLMI